MHAATASTKNLGLQVPTARRSVALSTDESPRPPRSAAGLTGPTRTAAELVRPGGVDDMNGDKVPDLIAVVNSTDEMYLYPGQGERPWDPHQAGR